ncbi:RimJ/RimL family protein N-acetyltransferase [Pseudochelatococcus lubricantis]|uniref:RimJ/RimL family protein N-acetyltransferase n=1 Tax=Pseudochelatococcus lubricantis TaxID=1538102 RepID=A0ABX0V5F2_9HYPH|nr:GNAT family N-acetyltransferase [Pseudochelatococcus lubricantis]NIJ60177.1 RimJ/RimL family protein N-acetyltransferase [Pseudochelatococcus lubricantis]
MPNVSFGPLETERLLLNPLQPEHAAQMWEVLRDPALYTWIPREPPGNVAAVENRFKAVSVGRSADGREQWLNWTVWLRTTGAPVGLFEATIHEDGKAYVAYMIRQSFWRRRYALEGMKAVVSALFSNGVKEIEAEIDSRNVPSISLMSRLGFVFVERKSKVEFFKGAWSDEEVWRILPSRQL